MLNATMHQPTSITHLPLKDGWHSFLIACEGGEVAVLTKDPGGFVAAMVIAWTHGGRTEL
jgi:hypothetical protein